MLLGKTDDENSDKRRANNGKQYFLDILQRNYLIFEI